MSKSTSNNSEDKKAREAQQAAHKAADWARVLKCTPRGGGAFVMTRRGK